MQHRVKYIETSSEAMLNTIKTVVHIHEKFKFLTVHYKRALNSMEEILIFENIFLHNLDNVTSCTFL